MLIKHSSSSSSFCFRSLLFLTMKVRPTNLNKPSILVIHLYGRLTLSAYLVRTGNCEILEVHPSTSPLSAIFHKMEPTLCSDFQSKPLSKIVYNFQRTEANLVIFPHLFQNYSTTGEVECHYDVLSMFEPYVVNVSWFTSSELFAIHINHHPLSCSIPVPF